MVGRPSVKKGQRRAASFFRSKNLIDIERIYPYIISYFNFYWKDFYGRPDKESVGKIKQLFNDLELQKEYEMYENTKFERIMLGIDELSFQDEHSQQFTEQIKQVLKNYAQKIFKRNK